MLAAVYHGPEDLRVEERPMPAIGSNEALLKVVSAGICGTDLRILHGGHPKDRPTIQFDSNLVHYKELRVTGTTACNTGDCRQAASIVNAGRVGLSQVVSGRFPLSAAREAFAAAEDRTSLKIVVEP